MAEEGGANKPEGGEKPKKLVVTEFTVLGLNTDVRLEYDFGNCIKFHQAFREVATSDISSTSPVFKVVDLSELSSIDRMIATQVYTLKSLPTIIYVMEGVIYRTEVKPKDNLKDELQKKIRMYLTSPKKIKEI